MDTRAFHRMVRERVNGLGIEESKRATAVVLRAPRDRLTRKEAEQVATQLPAPLKAVWNLGDRPGRRPSRFDATMNIALPAGRVMLSADDRVPDGHRGGFSTPWTP